MSFILPHHNSFPAAHPRTKSASSAFCHWQQTPALATLTGALCRHESWFSPSIFTISNHKEYKILCLNEKSFPNQQQRLLLSNILINLCKYTTEKQSTSKSAPNSLIFSKFIFQFLMFGSLTPFQLWIHNWPSHLPSQCISPPWDKCQPRPLYLTFQD